jgi:hypothetical protein
LAADESVFVENLGLWESIRAIKQKIDTNGPYDVLLGISVSSPVITAATAWYQHEYGSVPWRCNFLFSPFSLRDNAFLATYMKKKIDFPHLIIFGTGDEYWDHVSRSLVEYDKPNVLLHSDKHRFPRDKDVRLQICKALLSFRQPVREQIKSRL